MKTLLIGWFDEDKIKAKFNIKDNDLYIISDKARRMIYKKKKTKNVYYIDSIYDIHEYEKALEKIGMKFDKVIMNPPYETNLHLKIIDVVKRHVDAKYEIINIAPGSWFLDEYAKYKKSSDWNKYKHTLDDLSSLVSVGTAEELFDDVNFGCNLYIYKFTDKGGYDISYMQNNSILDKVVNYCLDEGHSLEDHMGKYSKGNIVVVNRIYGGDYKNGGIIKDYLFRYSGEDLKKFKTGNNGSILFKTEKEAKNFSDAAKTKFYSYLMKQHRQSIRWNTKYFPFMIDYTKPWTDERFYKYFNITKEEQKIIEDTMKQYETK